MASGKGFIPWEQGAMGRRATNISGQESARLSVSSSRQVDEKRPNRTLDAHDLLTDTNARLRW
jgi:hypothetical protein